MAAIVGKDGSFRIGTSTVGYIDSFVLNVTLENDDITAFGNKTHRRAHTLIDWSMDATGTLDTADAQQAALLDQFKTGGTLAPAEVRGYTGTSAYWVGSALLTSVSINSAVGSKVSVSYNFSCNGELNRV